MRTGLPIRYIVAIPVCLALTFVVAGHLRWPGSVGDTPQSVAAQQAIWKARQPAGYILTVTHTSGDALRWFTLSEVTRGKVGNVLCRRYERNDSIAECAVSAELYPLTVEQVFAAIETAYRGKFRGIDVRYDPQTGFPATVRFDPSSEKTGDEWGYDVELLVRPTGGRGAADGV